MTFAAIETSLEEGQPLELLMVSYLTNHWYYTTADEPVTYDGHVYEPLPITHGAISQTGDTAKSQLIINVPQDCPVGELFRIQPPSGVVTVTLFAKHAQDAEVKVIWKGRIQTAEWQQPWLSLITESVFTSLQRTGLRRKFGAQCPHALYGLGLGLCNVDKAAFKEDYTVTSVTGLTVNCAAAAGKPVDWFAGGMIEWVHATSGYAERRMVVASDASGNLTLPSLPPGLLAGMTLSAYPGCDHSLTMCDDKFDNAINFGGQPYIPTKNPFNGSTLY